MLAAMRIGRMTRTDMSRMDVNEPGNHPLVKCTAVVAFTRSIT